MRNLIVINTNSKGHSWIIPVLHSLSSYFDEKIDKQDFLISGHKKGFLNKIDSNTEDLIRKLKPFARNIFACYKSEIKCITGSKKELYFEYDNIIFCPMIVNNALANNKINELNIKYKKKYIIPTGDDIDRAFIIKTLSNEDVAKITDFILDCKNIVSPSSRVDYFPMKNDVRLLNYTLPTDIELYSKLKEKKIDKDFSSLDIQIFTKPQHSKKTIKALMLINKKKYNIRTLAIFPKLNIKDGVLSILKQLYLILKLQRNKKIGLVLFQNHRKKEIYYPQLNTFNSLYIQRRGGGTSIRYAVMQGLLIFGDLETPNAKVLKKDYNVKVFDFDKFDLKKYTQKDLERIVDFNKRNLFDSMEKSKNFYRNLFYSNNTSKK